MQKNSIFSYYNIIMSNDNSNKALDNASLEHEYNLLMEQYNKLHQEYVLELNKIGISDLVVMPGNFWGTSAIDSKKVEHINDCKTLCSANSKCSGATFRPSSSTCFLRSGPGNINQNASNDYAIVTKLASVLSNLKATNEHLSQLSSKLSLVSQPNQQQTYDDMTSKLGQQKNEIDNAISKTNTILSKNITLESDYTNSYLKAQSNMYWYTLYLFLAMLLCLVMIQMSIFGSSSSVKVGGGSKKDALNWIVYLEGIIIFSLLGFAYLHNSVWGYSLWSLVVIAFVGYLISGKH